MIYNITPVPAPRQNRSVKWNKRPCDLRYFAFKDAVRAAGVQVPEAGAHITFHLPMPKSWSKKKKAEMDGKPHQQKPDVDNMLKALLDAVYNEDCTVWNISATKLWSREGKIEITEENQ